MKTSPKQTLSKLFFGLFFCVLTACFSQKNTLFNRNLQNLTAHYNILYNANLLLDESEQNIRLAYQDNYNHLIPVYQEPNETLSKPQEPKLDEALIKANKIINEKTQSQYLGNAYFVIAKANHLKSNFFNAIGFFDYVSETYKKQGDLGQASLAWKARSLIQLELFDEAQSTLDSALKHIDLKKKSAADIYATRAQMHIYKNQNEEAITLLSKALKLLKNRRLDRIRWTYLLAQLQQLTGKIDLAYANYTKIVRSNADFTMAFNANLNRITIEAEENGAKIDRVARLKKLLKDDNNTELIDQIYYHIGKVYEEDKDIENAIKNYKIAIRNSTKNQNQKGLSYLKLADIYFSSADYIKSKAYYDSTLATLSKDNPDYRKIQKKASHIELLADRLSTIAKENWLQGLAQFPEEKRNSQIDSILTEQIANASSTTERTPSNSNANQQISGNSGDQKFYFSNTTALNQGQSIFKKTWGDRVLEDDWRRSQKANLSINDINNSANQNHQPNTTGISSTTDSVSLKQFDKAKRALIASIPLTPEQCIISDQKIASAYFDIANHYREVINDPEEAIRTYEKLLTLYPDNHNKLATYYDLYRLYESRDPDKSTYYKNLILTEYPESIFAKTILNPNYSQKTSELEWALNLLYNETYCTYVEKKYDEVIRYTGLSQTKFGLNKLSPQLAYLEALAIGHTHKLDVFESSLKQITSDFAGDSLVVPLIQKQLLFINAHRKSFASRQFALLDNDSSELPFFEEPKMEAITPTNIKVEDKLVPTSPITPTHLVEIPKVIVPDHSHFFSTEESVEYYFVVDVTESTFNLSSSRFGIGQFNRTRFPDNQIKHQLKLLENQNQLIFVGVFSSKDAAADYYSKINPLMSQIMKIPTNKYTTFYISKQNLEKLTNREIIDWYIDFFKKTVNIK